MDETNALFEDMLRRNTLCVLATASNDGKPEAATIEYVTGEGFELYFETFVGYGKYPNLKQNRRVSIVITELPHTIQMDGIAEELQGSAALEAKKRMAAKHDHAFYNDPHIRFFKFTQQWIRIMVGGKHPPRYEVIMQ
jgi:general stress protein 26